MPKMPHVRKLHDYETEMIRMVASGATNAEIAVATGTAVETVRSRLHVVHRLIGSASEIPSENMARVRMVIWAYDHGIVRPARSKPARPPKDVLPQDRIRADLAAPMIRLSISILADESRGDLKVWAKRVMDAAGLRMPTTLGRPVAVAEAEVDLCGDEAA